MSGIWSHRMAAIVILAVCCMIVPSTHALAAADAAKESAGETATDAANEEAAAEDESATDGDDAGEIGIEETEDAFSDEDLEDLVARVALYPDPLLAQILIASTEPIDVVRAARWTEDNETLDGDERAAALEDEDWDPSVKTLTAFPSVLKTMSDDLEWTETLGDAFVAQSDDVLDAVQVMRAQAQAAGSLQTTEQQEVIVEDDAITIEPAEPEVIYVPQYDPQAVYGPASSFAPGAAAPTAAYPAGTEAYPPTTVVDDSGFSTGAMLATGALSFGAGVLVNELFDDDDNDWGDNFDWDDHEVYRGGGGKNVNVGDVNIDKSVNVDGGAWKPNKKQKAEAQNRVKQKKAKLDVKAPGKKRTGERKAKRASSVEGKLAARGHDRDSVKRAATNKGGKSAARQKVSSRKGGAFEGKKSAPKVKKERKRGAASVNKSREGKAKSVKQASKSPRASKASKARAHKTAFSGSHNGKSAKAATKRGHKSAKAKKQRKGKRRK